MRTAALRLAMPGVRQPLLVRCATVGYARCTAAVSRMMCYGSREQTMLWQAYGIRHMESELAKKISSASEKKKNMS